MAMRGLQQMFAANAAHKMQESIAQELRCVALKQCIDITHKKLASRS